MSFKYSEVEGAGGRRMVVHEYPTRDEPDTEDLGRKAREFTIEAYLLGDDYMAARDRLVAALEEAGPGTLVHPYRGQISVMVRDYRLRETTREGGAARISISFVEAGRAFAPQAVVDTARRVNAAAASARASALAAFSGRFSVSGTSFIRLAAEELLGDAARLRGGLEGIAQLIDDPQALGQAVVEVLAGVGRIDDIRPILSYGADARPVPLTTPSRRQQAANQAAVIRMVQMAALTRAAEVSAETEYPSLDDALKVRDELTDK
ncbi:MAG TPA: DNA circularization N-terminal domain-containing protein, partial [Methylomirabilota bacterium]|nr:DNA circularization N-terminal domain-containing protein [Methylomirabilota bacterium]